MLSALIPSAGRKPAVPLAGQLAHESCVRPGPLVLGTALLRSPTAATDRDRTVSRRSKPSSRTALMGEQPNPWDLLPPQSNYPPAAVPDPDHGSRLELRHEQGGISRLAPPRLTPELPSLPPILHNPYQNPTSSCSKGPRGLSVLSQLTSIFTRTS